MSWPLPLETVVAVAGAGAMGAGIAQVAAMAGHRVRLLDNRPDVAARAVAGIQAQLAKMAERGRLTAADAAAAGERLTPVHALADLAGAGLVVEAIVEDLAEKQALFADLEGIAGRDCLLCSNTSAISLTAIGAALNHPERLAGKKPPAGRLRCPPALQPARRHYEVFCRLRRTRRCPPSSRSIAG